MTLSGAASLFAGRRGERREASIVHCVEERRVYSGVPASVLPTFEVSYLFDLRLGLGSVPPSPSLLLVY